MKIFEFGSGGSTIFFASRGARVTSVEHDPEFAESVRGRLRRLGLEVEQLWVRAPKATGIRANYGPDSFTSARAEYADLSFRDYVESIESIPPASRDIVVVDGRARASCLVRAVSRVSEGGALILDNAERTEYRPARYRIEQEGWRGTSFFGLGPGSPYAWETVMYRRTGEGKEARV